MYVISRILKHMALVDFVTLPTYSLEQCALRDLLECGDYLRASFEEIWLLGVR